MGKVRKLRKKYRALCSKNSTTQFPQQEELELPSSLVKEMPVDQPQTIGNSDQAFDAKSAISISKSIKSCVAGIKKKDKQKLRHQLFLNRVQVTQPTTLGKRKMKRSQRNVDLSKMSSKTLKSEILNSEQPQIPLKTANFKGISKVRHKNLLNDIFIFKKNLKEDSFHCSPHETVTTKTLEKLSSECSRFQNEYHRFNS